MTQHPSEITKVKLGDGYGDFVRMQDGIPVEAREYHFTDSAGAP